MKTIGKTLVKAVMVVAGISFFCFSLTAQQPKPWDVPAEFKNMKNPVARGEESNKAGLAIYTKYCASCHGKTGLGDGVKARMLKDSPGDLSKDYYQNQTDGEQFYKTKTGRNDMPKYEGKLSDENIWNVVNYMRTFKK